MKRYKFKLCLFGSGGVGKTSLIRRYVYDEFDDKYLQTIGTKVSKKVVDVFVNGEDVEVQLYMGHNGSEKLQRCTQGGVFPRC